MIRTMNHNTSKHLRVEVNKGLVQQITPLKLLHYGRTYGDDLYSQRIIDVDLTWPTTEPGARAGKISIDTRYSNLSQLNRRGCSKTLVYMQAFKSLVWLKGGVKQASLLN